MSPQLAPHKVNVSRLQRDIGLQKEKFCQAVYFSRFMGT